MTALAIANLLIGLGFLIIGLPLACRKVPMNYSYGWRTQAAFESNERWYEINAYYGRRMAKFGGMIPVGLVGLFLPQTHLLGYTIISCLVPVLMLVLPVERLLEKKGVKSSTRH
jgi:SdpI/YfhL protein family